MTNHESPNHRTPLHSDAEETAHDVVGHHHHHHKKPRPKPSVTLNVTSMVDILFNLLVYFIVTVNFTIDEGALKAKLPLPPGVAQAEKAEEEDTSSDKYPILVESTRDGYACNLLFNSRRVATFAELSKVLTANNSANGAGGKLDPKSVTIVIQPQTKVRWQHVVNAFNQAVHAGYHKISFADGN